jgi:hypothetical protein
MPDGLPTLAAWLLAAIFAAAATTKLRDPAATARGFAALGVPRPWLAARLTPAAEVVVAGGLVIAPAVGGGVALAVLVFFSTFLAGRLRHGVRVPCGCFGASARHPLSGADLLRNGLLALAAVVALGDARPRAPSVTATVLAAAGSAAGAGVVRLARVRAATTSKGAS